MALEVDPSALLKASVRAQRNLNIHTCVCENVCPFCTSDLTLKDLEEPIYYDGAEFFTCKECVKCYSCYFLNNNKKWAFLETGMT